MLVGFQPANEAFIDFDRATQLVQSAVRTIAAASLAQATENEPRGFLSDADFFRELQPRDSLARGDQQVHGVEPLVQRNLAAAPLRCWCAR